MAHELRNGLDNTLLEYEIFQQLRQQYEQHEAFNLPQSCDDLDMIMGMNTMQYHQQIPPPPQAQAFSQHAPTSSSSNTPPTALAAMPDPQKPTFSSASATHSAASCDIKPRLTKEQHDLLEAHFQKQNKPNTNTKKSIAEVLAVPVEKVNNWFQNRRAKAKQDLKKLAASTETDLTQPLSSEVSPNHDQDLPERQQSGASTHLQSHSQSDPQSESQSPVFETNLAHHEPSIQLPFHCQQLHDRLVHDQDSTASNDISDAQLMALLHPYPANTLDLSSQYPTVDQSSVNFVHVVPQQLSGHYNSEHLSEHATHGQGFGGLLENTEEIDQSALNQAQYTSSVDHSRSICPSMPTYALEESTHMGHMNSATTPSQADHVSSSSTTQSTTHTLDLSSISPYSLPDSRSSSISASLDEANVTGLQHHHMLPSQMAQWQHEQAMTADFTHSLQNNQVLPLNQSAPQGSAMMWPSQALSRRESHSNLLADHMSSIVLQTPQPTEGAQFKAPRPPSSIAARRQRPRPAALGIGTPRSQSYNGPQPLSPGLRGQPPAVGQIPQPRRMRSHIGLAGVSQGRVQKSLPGSAPRSPVTWTHADPLNSPQVLRHQSSGALAPPTPMSPQEFSWSHSNGLNNRPSWSNNSMQPSIDENEAEYLGSCAPTPITAIHSQNNVSPPQTPMGIFHQTLRLQRMPGFAHDTPPQSAPATKTSFGISFPQPVNNWHGRSEHGLTPSVNQNHITSGMLANQPLPYGMSPSIYANSQASASNMPHAHGLYNSAGASYLDLASACPATMHQFAGPLNATPQAPISIPHFETRQSLPTSLSPTQISASSSEKPKAMLELTIEEYAPPMHMSRPVTDSKSAHDNIRKDYTFAHHVPGDFERGKKPAESRLSLSVSDKSNDSS